MPDTPEGGLPRDATAATTPPRRDDDRRGIVTDPELSRLLIAGTEALGEQGLDRFLRAHQRFNRPTLVMQPDGSTKRDENYSTKRVLEEVPSYVTSAKGAGLESQQTEDLLLHTINASQWDFERNDVNIPVLTRALQSSVDHGEALTGQDVEKIQTMITLGARESVIPHSLYAYEAARKAGLSFDDSIKLVTDFLESDFMVAAGYAMPHFDRALATLKVAQVDPEVTKETFAAFQGVQRGERDSAYDLFKDAITFACPARKMKPEEFMRAINLQIQAGQGQVTIVDAIGRVLGDDLQLLAGDSEPTVLVPREEREKYFTSKPGNLENAVLPYRTERGFNDGLRDLEKLAEAKGYKWEDVSEGHWVFDPEAQTWYSLGGEGDRG